MSLSSLDRTREFLAAVKSVGVVSGSRVTAAGSSQGVSAAPIPQTRSAFLQAVGDVSGDLQSASRKLAALTVLVRRRGMLADPGHEIEALTTSVKGDIGSLTGKLDALASYVDAKRAEAQRQGVLPGGIGAVDAFGSKVPGAPDRVLNTAQGITHSETVLASLRTHLLGFGRSLKGILVARTESLKSQATRRHALGASRDLGLPPPSTFAASAVAAPAQRERGQPAAAAAAALFSKETPAEARARRLGLAPPAAASSVVPQSVVSPTASTTGIVPLQFAAASSPAADPFAQVQQSALLPASDADAAYLDARASDVQALERHIGDLSSLFGRLAVVVHEQGALVERIEDNVGASLRNVGAAQGELQRAWERARSNGGLVLRVTAVLLLFIFLFIFFA